ncbi:LysR family transcriptional regulator [[Clostridium] symbiosum]|uniref:LysR family transcriptional regulator n=1 Tax=Clostridium symbiosum TaxID=1512 RepID=UPI001D080E85|nr:LysR family transcriptional regulator [[Clostridium] symbiosum]MCB6610608.1 LysR family transcriptional regulator [[Clostridium] symbiosum]MCB6930946.1 LysR family transcriptional regulator [[Clostridium] symbiosum]
MNIRQLEYFIKVYESGSFLGAAESLFISQQALSQALATLEKELNAPLFYREHKGVIPTPLGKELYISCQPALHEMNKLEKHILKFIRENYGHLKIGLAAGCRYFNSKTVWKNFLIYYPNVSFDVEEYTYKKCIELFDKREIDILICSDYSPGKNYYQAELKTLRRVLILPRGHKLCQKESVGIEALKEETFVLSINDLAYEHFIDYCDKNNCLPKEILRVSDTLYMFEACNRDRCAGITIDGYFTDIFLSQFPDLQTLPLSGNLFPYTITLMAQKNHPNLALIMSLASYLKEYLRDKS